MILYNQMYFKTFWNFWWISYQILKFFLLFFFFFGFGFG